MNKTMNMLFGVCSLVGLVITIATLTHTLNKINALSEVTEIYSNLSVIYKALGYTIVALIVIFLVQSILFNNNLTKLQQQLGRLPVENEQLADKADNYIRIYKGTTGSIHNIIHSYRYIYILLRDAVIELRKDDCSLSEKECRSISNSFEKYIFHFLLNLTTTFNVITDDDCAACIKLLRDGKIKTLYRDPYSYRYRKKSDRTQRGEIFIYNTSDNYAFNLITNNATQETFFSCDDLLSHEKYFNRNHEWKKLYNATIVVPIQANLSGDKNKNEMHIIGFICCDNMTGGFENREAKDFISATGDLMFNLFHLYDRFIQLSLKKGFDNEALHQYDNWNDC